MALVLPLDRSSSHERSRHPSIAVLIATRNRPELLAERALRSVVLQTIRPTIVVVVDDSDEARRPESESIVQALAESLAALYLHNARTPGASGAWNTGLAWLYANVESPEDLIVAVLDDDDHWEPFHLETCLREACQRDLDMVIAGIVRHDELHAHGREQGIPERLSADDFLVGNPHVQGSNLFVRLGVLLQAGLFDETLASTTDRDLCIRIADLGDVRVGAAHRHTVHHHAGADVPRLSSPEGSAKKAGLDGFWQKYKGRMTPAQRRAFLDRASTLFAWSPPSPQPLRAVPTLLESTPQLVDGLSLVVGIAIDAHRIFVVEPLLDDLLALAREGIAGLDVVLLENGPRADDGVALRAMIAQKRRAGLRVYGMYLEQQREDARRGTFGDPFERGDGRVGIAAARTMLQTYVYHLAHRRPGSVAWILDDDKRLHALVRRGESLARERLPFLHHLTRLKATGVSVALGLDTDSPPLPAASSLRVQLVDLLHNLRWLAQLRPDDPLPNRIAENLCQEERSGDYYYDLSSRCTAHLEAPFWLLPARPGETAREAFARVAARAPRILAGEQVFRPLHVEADVDPVSNAIPSVHRGGSTFVFDLEALRAVPNLAPDLGAGELRRSDMVWSLINTRCMGRRVVRAALPVSHERGHLPAERLDLGALAIDTQGHALYSALRDLLDLHPSPAESGDIIALTEGDLSFAVDRFRSHAAARVEAFALSFHRMRGLLKSIRRALAEMPATWREDAEIRRAVAKIATFIDALTTECGAERLAAFRASVMEVDPAELHVWFSDLRRRMAAHQRAMDKAPPPHLDEQRAHIAKSQLERLCDATELRLLGAGAEGVVFTDGTHVYKVFDYWKTRASEKQRGFLKSLVGAWRDTKTLYPLLRLEDRDQSAILVYPYEPGEPYRGGHGADLVCLLRECREQGIVCRNIHPKNLLVTERGLRLIDYGSDIHPFTEPEFEHMCRRAYLTWRWHHRPDLNELMRKALRSDELPELDGFDRFRRAVEPTTTTAEVLNARLLSMCLSRRPARVLDYGCGKAKLAHALAAEGVEVVGYDPDPTLHVRWDELPAPSLQLFSTSERLSAEAQFDVVVCSLVLCTLEGSDYEAALRDLRSLVRDDGRVIIAICNPFFTLGGATPLQARELPEGACYEDTFCWHKVVASTGTRRRDVHRPLDRLRRDLLRAGLDIECVEMTETVDVARFEPASDFLILTARPTPLDAPKVSLLLRTCAMEWRTIEEQVRHVVGHLEGPRAFFEKVLIIDCRTSGFLRQYTTGDESAHAAAVDRLVRAGLIDRVERVPADPEALGALHERWFGVKAKSAHTASGAPVAAPLLGFEACRGDYVLHVDSDLLVVRHDRAHDYLGEMIRVCEQDADALTVALNICHDEDRPYTSTGPHGPFRVEVRGCLMHRERLGRTLPLPNQQQDGLLARPWHRAMDERISQGPFRSYRGGDHRTFFIHPSNDWKADVARWFTVLDRVEAGHVPRDQVGQVDLCGSRDEWLGPKRTEPFIFVMTGRNVPPGRLLRCIESVRRQRGAWGAIVIDDGSDALTRDFLPLALEGHQSRVTLLRTRLRRGQLANMIWAIRQVCVDPESVIITLDMDDALLGGGVLDRVAKEYACGADATVGSMLRTDKHAVYPATLEDPRANRGGNVWQHLRTFRKKLFDAIPDEALRLDGEYVDLANDWAYMIPLIERAQRPVFISDPLYLHEPSGTGKDSERQDRERQIARILAHQELVLRGAVR